MWSCVTWCWMKIPVKFSLVQSPSCFTSISTSSSENVEILLDLLCFIHTNILKINLLPTVRSDWLQTIGGAALNFLQSDRTVGSKLFGVNEGLQKTVMLLHIVRYFKNL